MFQPIMVGPFGDAFMRDVKKAKRAIYLWTVNQEEAMKWSIYNEVDGVISDDPKKFLEVCERYQGEKVNLAFKSLVYILFINVLVSAFTVVFKYKYRSVAGPKKARTAVQSSEEVEVVT
jgi:phosphatidylglycerol phospholipase C